MSFTYYMSSNGCLTEYNNGTQSYQECATNGGFTYDGPNSTYYGDNFYIKLETSGKYCIYFANKSVDGSGHPVYTPTGSALLCSP